MPSIHLVRVTDEDHKKLVQMAEAECRSVPSQLHVMINEAGK